MNIFKKRKQSIYFIIYIPIMIFVQGCSVDNATKTDKDLSGDDDRDLKINKTNSDKASINLANTCPRGLACVFPGRCTLYTDKGYDKICDRANLERSKNVRGL